MPRYGLTRGSAAPAIVLAAGAVAGCDASGGDSVGNVTTIRVMGASASTFYSDYGAIYSALHPNIRFELLPSPEESDLAQAVEEEKPDLFMLSQSGYADLAEQGRLQSLEPYIKKDKFDLEGTVPAVIEAIKSWSGGRLYGLAPFFSNWALYYNKDLFDRYGVQAPSDGMSWAEALRLAQRFPAGGTGQDRVYGLAFPYGDPFELAIFIGGANGLNYLDRTNLRMTLDDDRWRDVFTLVKEATASGALYQGNGSSAGVGASYADTLKQHPFIAGQAAMTLSSPQLALQLKEASTYNIPAPNWDLAAAPGTTGSLDVGSIWALSAQAEHPKEAWEFIRYVSGDDYARATAQVPRLTGEITTRVGFLTDAEGHHMEAFHNAKAPLPQGVGRVPQSFYALFDPIAEDETGKAMAGTETIEEALARMQEQGQQLLDQAKLKEP